LHTVPRKLLLGEPKGRVNNPAETWHTVSVVGRGDPWGHPVRVL
jgi:hypothetical protein